MKCHSHKHYGDVIMGVMASQESPASRSFTQPFQAHIKKHQSSASLAFVRIIHRWPVNSLHKGYVTRKMSPFDNVIMIYCRIWSWSPMPCEKHGPRDSVDKNRGRRPRFLSLLRPEGHVFHTAWETMIKSYYSTLADWFFHVLFT